VILEWFVCLKVKLLVDIEEKDNETMALKKEVASLKQQLTLASQANDEIRGKILEYQLELQNLEVCNA